MRNYYLEILELSPEATEKDIKSAYRRLSKQYHPDRNPGEDTSERFIEITQAYNYLTDTKKYTYARATTYQKSEDSGREQWRQEAQARVRQQRQEEAIARETLIRKLLSYFNFAAIALLIFNGLLAIDYLLPRKAHPQQSLRVEKVFESSRYQGRTQSYQYDDLHFEDFTLRIDKGQIKSDDFFDEAVVLATSIFGKPQAALLTADGQTTRYEPIYSVYTFFGFIIPAMLLLLGLYWLVIKSSDQRLSLAILMLVISIIQALLFIIV
ncbi:J domain-containing protein [Tunicatimonas pelagia]|uniref:J domain-containing protein n=1 Tax=Tunicatimonas pelagia TaxID=931531 RepID=UPI0026671A17|nr:J domain-containing protein [Tunicatimonas pelagia]WKN40941.1 DnaJ domain-containing protein [Tunicatimonas pelagia]